MVQAADFGQLNHVARCWPLNSSWLRCVAIKRQVAAGSVVVFEVTEQHATQVLLIQHDHVVQAFSPYGTNQPFDEWILPR